MRPDTAAFIAVAVVVIVTPGIDMALIARNGLAGGFAPAWRTAMGVLVGVGVHAAAATVGLSTILATSATAFRIVKIAGGIYLLYLGARSIISGWASSPGQRDEQVVGVSERPFVTGLVTNLLNPKLAVFFVSLLPQFVRPGDPPVARTALLAGTFLALAVGWLAFYSWLISRLGRVFTGPRFGKIVETLSGTVLIGLGLRVLATER